MREPKVTISFPVYNTEAYLEEALISLSRQTYENFVILAVDDASTDRSLERLKKYALKEPRLKIIPRQGKGLPAALNAMIQETQTEYFARMDSDDICMPTRLEKQVAYLDSHPCAVAVSSKMLAVDPEMWPIEKFPACEKPEELLGNLLYQEGPGYPHAATMMRTIALKKIGGYCTHYAVAEDIDLWLKLMEEGELHLLDSYDYLYRQRKTSMIHTSQDFVQETLKTIQEDCIRRRGNKSLPIPHPRNSVCSDLHPVEKAQSSASLPNNWHGSWSLRASNAGFRSTAIKHALLSYSQRSDFSSWAWLFIQSVLGPNETLKLKNFWRACKGLPEIQA